MFRRKSPTRIIETTGNPKFEQGYMKNPRGRLKDVTIYSGPYGVHSDFPALEENYMQRGKPFMQLHTHPNSAPHKLSALPSIADLLDITKNRRMRTSVIAQRDENTGKVQGYTFLHNKNSELKQGESRNQKIDYLNRLSKSIIGQKSSSYAESIEGIAKKVGVDIRYHPARGYYFNRGTGNYEKKPTHNLEGIAASVLLGFIFLALLSRISFTGNIVSDLSMSNFGIGFFILLGLFISLIVYCILRLSAKRS